MDKTHSKKREAKAGFKKNDFKAGDKQKSYGDRERKPKEGGFKEMKKWAKGSQNRQ